jgi:hypothetical protein
MNEFSKLLFGLDGMRVYRLRDRATVGAIFRSRRCCLRNRDLKIAPTSTLVGHGDDR